MTFTGNILDVPQPQPRLIRAQRGRLRNLLSRPRLPSGSHRRPAPSRLLCASRRVSTPPSWRPSRPARSAALATSPPPRSTHPACLARLKSPRFKPQPLASSSTPPSPALFRKPDPMPNTEIAIPGGIITHQGALPPCRAARADLPRVHGHRRRHRDGLLPEWHAHPDREPGQARPLHRGLRCRAGWRAPAARSGRLPARDPGAGCRPGFFQPDPERPENEASGTSPRNSSTANPGGSAPATLSE